MSKPTIIQVNEYTPINPHLLGWTVPTKPKKTLAVKKQVKRNERSSWAKEGFNTETVYSGDLLAQMFEQTEKDLAPQRFPDQEDFKDAERRMGKRMLHTEFIKKVLSLNKKLLYEDSLGVKDSGAFYVIEGKSKIYTGACFRKGWLPEWTIIKTDAADLPTQDGLTYGWRVPLQRLVQKKLITYRQVVKVFGDVFRKDLCGKNWALNTGNFRN